MKLDLKNTLNSVEHEFVYEVPRKCNLNKSFINWVLLLIDIKLCVINTEHTFRRFKSRWGLQQGCPASEPLFALAVEFFAIKMNESTAVGDIDVNGITLKLPK